MTSSVSFVQARQIQLGRKWMPCGGFFAVDGTAYPGSPNAPTPILDNGSGFWSGFSSGMVGGLTNLLDGLWASFCIAYEASTVPMWSSVQQARGYLVACIDNFAKWFYGKFGFWPPICLSGYSQGSMVTDQVWLLDILSPNGALHYLAPYVYRIYQFGHIFRNPGNARGNVLAGLPESISTDGVETGGIGCELDNTNEQVALLAPDGQPIMTSTANKGDIYGACPTGLEPWSLNTLANPAKTGRLFFKVVMDPTPIDVIELVEVIQTPIASIEEGIATAEFFAQGNNSPHYQYYAQMDACINDAYQLGLSLPHTI